MIYSKINQKNIMGMILALNERWNCALHMRVERKIFKLLGSLGVFSGERVSRMV